MAIPRSVRNHNPGNLRRVDGVTWEGEQSAEDMTPDQQGETTFVVFKNDIFGFRALAKTLLNYDRLHGLKTIRAIMSRFAPINENDTDAYIDHVCSMMGAAPASVLNLGNPATLRALCKAIAIHEAGGRYYSLDELASGVGMALAMVDAPIS